MQQVFALWNRRIDKMNTNIKIQDKPVKSMTIKEAAEEMGKTVKVMYY